MRVKELIEALRKADPNGVVTVYHEETDKEKHVSDWSRHEVVREITNNGDTEWPDNVMLEVGDDFIACEPFNEIDEPNLGSSSVLPERR